MSLRIVPPAANPTVSYPITSAASAPGLPDRLSTLSHSAAAATTLTSTSTNAAKNLPTTSSHPLEARLLRWQSTQDNMKLESLRRTFGIAEPVRRAMELKIVDQGEWRPAVLGGGVGLHGDILRGMDGGCSYEDIFTGNELRPEVSFHQEMEARLGMRW